MTADGAPMMRPDEGAAIRVNGACLVALRDGALLWPDRETLVVADIHFEKGAALARRGAPLPPYDTRASLGFLERLIGVHRPRQVISLGDAFHRADSESFMDPEDAQRLEALTARARWVWILGNHDPAPPKRFAGDVAIAKRIGRLVFRHEPQPAPSPGEIAGHLHPCARVRTDVGGQRRRCFATDGERLLMPAIGAYAGGLNVLDPAIRPLFGSLEVHVPGRRALYRFSEAALSPDNAGVARLRA